MIKYFIYTRKSTDVEDKQVRSIEDQILVLRNLKKEILLKMTHSDMSLKSRLMLMLTKQAKLAFLLLTNLLEKYLTVLSTLWTLLTQKEELMRLRASYPNRNPHLVATMQFLMASLVICVLLLGALFVIIGIIAGKMLITAGGYVLSSMLQARRALLK